MSKGYINVWTSFQLFIIWTAAIPDLLLRPPAIITNYPLLFFPVLAPSWNLDENVLKGVFHEIFDFRFFHLSVSPAPEYPFWGRFEFWRKNLSKKFIKSKSIAGVAETGDKPLYSNIFANFFYKFEMATVGYSGSWRKLICENNQKLKISCQTSFKEQRKCMFVSM